MSVETAEKIKKILGKKTQAVLARELGITQGTTSLYASGRKEPGAATCLALAGICPAEDVEFWFRESGLSREAMESISAALKVTPQSERLEAREQELLEWWRTPSSPTEGYVRDLVEKVLALRTK